MSEWYRKARYDAQGKFVPQPYTRDFLNETEGSGICEDAKGWRREHAKAVCGAWLGLFNFMAVAGQSFARGFRAGRYDPLKSDT